MEALSKSQIVASSELKSGSWPTITTLAQQPFDVIDAHATPQRPIGVDLDPKAIPDTFGGLHGTQLGRRDDRVGLEADPEQERTQPFALLLALGRQRPVGVTAAPGLGVARVGVAEQVQLDGVSHVASIRD
jgi:hypothetical protein